MKWIVVSERSLVRESIRIYLEGVGGISKEDITPKSFDDIMITLDYPQEIEENNFKFIIEFYYFSKTKNQMQNLKESILDDPFDYHMSDLLATIFFDQRYFKGVSNWFLQKTMFFSFVGAKNYFLNDGKPFLHYCQLPQELDKLKGFINNIDFSEQNPLATVPQENLLFKMKDKLKPAFTHH